MLPICIKTIKFSEHRKGIGHQVDDYYIDNRGTLQIRITDLNNNRLEILLLIHALTEAVLCLQDGVKFKDIDEFDDLFEQQTKMGIHKEDDEPGDDLESPYRRQHFFATNIERVFAAHLGVLWEYYGRILNDLYRLPGEKGSRKDSKGSGKGKG